MAIVPIRLTPGVNVQKTQTLNEGSWSMSNMIRFFQGLPQKLGGWTQYILGTIVGVPRALHAWQSLAVVKYLAVATAANVYVVHDGIVDDVTPTAHESIGLGAKHGLLGSTILLLTDPTGYNPTLGSFVNFPYPVTIGATVPFTIFGIYPIVDVFGGGAFDIQLPTPLLSGVSVATSYQMPIVSVVAGSQIATISGMPNNYAVGGIFLLTLDAIFGSFTLPAANYTIVAVPNATTIQIRLLTVSAVTSSANFNSDQSLELYYATGSGNAITPNIDRLNIWSLDNWGEFLVACQYLGSIYIWQPQIGGVAAVIASAPNANFGVFVAMPEQIMVAYGSSFAVGGWDPLLIRWSTVSDYTIWTATSTNQAGSFRLPSGSQIVRGLQAPQQALFWTDIELWAMQYIGPPLVFGFNRIGQNCGLIAPNAVAVMASGIYWMSQNQFFVLDAGGVHQVPCPVWDQIFTNLDMGSVSSITACPNSFFNEIRWDYPSLDGSGQNDSYVKVDLSTGTWDYGNNTPTGLVVARTAWIDQSVLGSPIGTDVRGGIAQHEIGFDANMPGTNPTGAKMALTPGLETGWIMIAEGNNFTFVDQIYPDINFGTIPITGDTRDPFGSGDRHNAWPAMTIMVTVRMVDYPGDDPRVYGPYPVDRNTQYIPLRARGRQMSLSFTSDDLGSFWRLGMIRYRGQIVGRR